MIHSFLSSWSLFADVYAAGWLIAALLGCLGVLVIARDQVFVGAAVSQASMLGIVVGMSLERVLPEGVARIVATDTALSLLGGGFAVASAMLTASAGGPRRESREAVTGWVFLVGLSSSVLLAAHDPHGLEEVHRLLMSTLLGATTRDAWFFAAMALATAVLTALRADTLALLVTDEPMARAAGIPAARWNTLLWVWIGIGISAAIRVSGMTYAFGSLVLPALVAKNICREVRQMFVVAPLVGVLGAVVAFVAANAWDYPPGQAAVALWSLLLAAAWTAGRRE